jgi:hypothetical protein
MILFISFFGPIIFLIYSQRLDTYMTTTEDEIDDWEV